MNCPKCDSSRFYFVQRVYEYYTIENLKGGIAQLLDLEDTGIDIDYPTYLYCGSCTVSFDADENEILQPEILDVPISIETKGNL